MRHFLTDFRRLSWNLPFDVRLCSEALMNKARWPSAIKPIGYLLAAMVSASVLIAPVHASNNPIPGIDVVVNKKPSGGALAGVTGMTSPSTNNPNTTVFTTTTNNEGRFQLRGLPAGTYTLVFSEQGAAKAAISTSRSNIHRPNAARVDGGPGGARSQTGAAGPGKPHGVIRITNVRGNANQVMIIWAMLPEESGGKPIGPVTVQIAGDGGSITGTVVNSANLQDANTAMGEVSTMR